MPHDQGAALPKTLPTHEELLVQNTPSDTVCDSAICACLFVPELQVEHRSILFIQKMVATHHSQPLCSSPPDFFVSPPQPHALTTSQARILSPMIIVPGHSPITTTLSPSQLLEFLPTLHTYIKPSLPGIAFLPASSVSHKGLEQALRWETVSGSFSGTGTNLVEVVQIYQALLFLGNKPTGQFLRPLEGIIQGEVEKGFLLEACQAPWGLRDLPFTGKWIDLMFRRLASTLETIFADEAAGETAEHLYEGRLAADEEWRARLHEFRCIFHWVDENQEVKLRWEAVQARMDMEAKRARRFAKVMKMKSRRALARLSTVNE